MGNLQVRFLEGWAPAMAPGYSTLGITSRLPVTRPIARRSGTITGGRLRDEPSRNRSQTLWNRQDCRRKFRPDMHIRVRPVWQVTCSYRIAIREAKWVRNEPIFCVAR